MDYCLLAEKLVDLRMLMHLTPAVRKLSVLEQGTFLALQCLSDHQDAVHPKELSREMAISSARVAALLNHMEREEMIVRTADPNDSRQIMVSLTPEGKRLIQTKRKEVVDLMANALKGLEPEEAETYFRIQRKLLRNFMHQT